MLGYLATSSGPSRKDVQGVYRWLSGLRLTDAAVQLPCADKVLAWIASFLFFKMVLKIGFFKIVLLKFVFKKFCVQRFVFLKSVFNLLCFV